MKMTKVIKNNNNNKAMVHLRSTKKLCPNNNILEDDVMTM